MTDYRCNETGRETKTKSSIEKNLNFVTETFGRLKT